MREYELVVLFPPREEDESTDADVERIGGLITANGGEVSQVIHWGRRKLAYGIDDRGEAIYVLYKLKLEPAKVSEFESDMRLERELMRHLLVYDEGGEGPVIQAPVEEA